MSDSTRFSLSRRGALAFITMTAGGGAFLPAAALAQNSRFATLALSGAGVCTITPEVTEGPFYFDPRLQRSDITEGKSGAELSLRLQVVDTACKPVEGARVDIWHCDAEGAYSGYPGQGDGRDLDTSGMTFLRGWQDTDKDGIVTFRTIYPGWYRGRTTHIHFKVHPDQGTVMAGQLFFPDSVSDRIFSTVAPYNGRQGSRDTTNDRDGIARQAGAASQAEMRQADQAYEASLIIAVGDA